MLKMQIGRDRSVDRASVRQLADWLKTLDKESQREIKKGIKSEIGSVTSQMQGWINSQSPMPPMSGMGKTRTEWGWSGAAVKPSLRLSAGRGKPVAMITGQGGKPGMKKLFAIVERARNSFTDEGAQMVEVLNRRYPGTGKGGRLVWETWLEYRPELVDSVQRALDQLAKQYRRRGIRAVKGLFRG